MSRRRPRTVRLPARLTAPSDLVRVGLTDSDTTAGGTARLCEPVSFSRGLRYGESEANVLDVATTGETKADTPRPVLLFVGGDTFTGDRGSAGPVPRDPGPGDVLCRRATA